MWEGVSACGAPHAGLAPFITSGPRLMSVSGILAGITKLALDTAPLIYLVERDPLRRPRVLEILRSVDGGRVTASSYNLSGRQRHSSAHPLIQPSQATSPVRVFRLAKHSIQARYEHGERAVLAR